MKKITCLIFIFSLLIEQRLIAVPVTYHSKEAKYQDLTLLLGIQALGAQIKEIIEKAQAAGQILEVEAANQIATVIDQAKVALQYELDVAISKLDAIGAQTYNSLNSLVTDFLNHAYNDIKDLESRALVISHNLPLSKHFPQVVSWTPSYTYLNSEAYLNKTINWSKYISFSKISMETRTMSTDSVQKVSRAVDTIHFEVNGDFYDLPRKKFNATAEVNNALFTNSVKSSQVISFDIPSTNLVYSETSVKYNPIKVKIPYRKSTFLFFYKKRIAEFNLQIITLPKSVGSLTITTTVPVPGTITQGFSSGPYAQISDNDDIKCGGEHADLAIHCVPPPSGWRVIPSSVGYQMIRSEGDWYACGPDHSGLANACYSFSTIHHRFGTSGKIWFYITYLAQQDVITNQTEDHNIPIRWEESKVFILPSS